MKTNLIPKVRSDRRFKMGMLIVVFSLVYFMVITFCKIPNENIAYLIIGNINGALMTVLGTYFMTSDDKKGKDDNLKDELDG